MKNFIGTYECKIDDKGRIKLPASLTKQMEHFADEPFIVKRSVFQKCLEVYPMEPWDRLMAKINALNRFDAVCQPQQRNRYHKCRRTLRDLGQRILRTSHRSK